MARAQDDAMVRRSKKKEEEDEAGKDDDDDGACVACVCLSGQLIQLQCHLCLFRSYSNQATLDTQSISNLFRTAKCTTNRLLSTRTISHSLFQKWIPHGPSFAILLPLWRCASLTL